MKNNDDKRRAADRYAYLLHNHIKADANEINCLKEQLGLDEPLNMEQAPPEQDHDTIGVWTKTTDAEGRVSFIKDKRFIANYALWSKSKKIPPKSDQYRILFLGESVARGYLLDPIYTPSLCLKAMLNETTQGQDFEVVDLACSGISIKETLHLLEKSQALEPDAIVLFCGNNWNEDFGFRFSQSENQEFPYDQYKAAILEALDHKISELFRCIDDIRSVSGIPIFFMAPEFNCQDWTVSTSFQYDMKSRTLAEWIVLREEMDLCLRESKDQEAEALAKRMIGCNAYHPYPYEILSMLKNRMANRTEADDYKRKAIELTFFGPLIQTELVPMCPESVRGLIRQYCKRYGIVCVDLRQVFREYLQGGLPGHTLFLDYCHMTVEGINVACSALAKEILNSRQIRDASIQWPAFSPTGIQLSISHFFASIHSAHNGNQPLDYIKHHVRKALEYDESIKKSMIEYIRICVTKVPWCFNKTYIDLYTHKLVKHYSLKQELYIQLMDNQIVQAMVEVLNEKDIPLPFDHHSLKLQNHSRPDVNLMESYYAFDSNKQETMQNFRNQSPHLKNGYLVCVSHQSRFFYLTDAKSDVYLQLTARIHKQNCFCRLLVNGANVGRFEICSSWTDIQVLVEKKHFKADRTNIIMLLWPTDDFAGGYTQEMTGRLVIDEFMIFGEIYKFRAREKRGEAIDYA